MSEQGVGALAVVGIIAQLLESGPVYEVHDQIEDPCCHHSDRCCRYFLLVPLPIVRGVVRLGNMTAHSGQLLILSLSLNGRYLPSATAEIERLSAMRNAATC